MPDGYEEAWRKADEEYDQRVAQLIDDRIDELLDEHGWNGGYLCDCGHEINAPAGWGRHLLMLALSPPEA